MTGRAFGRLSRLLLLLAPVLAMAPAREATAAHIDFTVTFSRQDLTVSEYGSYDVIQLSGCDVSRDPGKPQLPVLPLTFALPDGAGQLRLEVVGTESRDLIERFDPLPAQHARILPIPGLEGPPWRFQEPDSSIYSQSVPYPPVMADIVSRGRLGGNTVVGVLVNPVQFVPDTGRVRLFSRIDLRLHYEEGPARPAGPPHLRKPLREVAGAVVRNGAAVVAPRGRVAELASRLDPALYEYVIITDAGYQSSFQPLVDWKTRKGVPATSVTVDWIETNYEGIDTQARIRSFVTDAYQTWGATWFLLGGDTQVVPARSAYAMTCDAGMHPDEDAIGCDLYYGDLDGTWDLDGDGTYGELADDVDLYPDVFVGRASVRTNEDVQAFVSKVLSYERDPEPGVGLDMLMAAEVLWTDPFTDSGIALNVIDREHVPPRYDPVTKLYETLGNETRVTVIEALNQGCGHFLHSGHAWYTVLGCGDGYMDRADADALTNGLKAPVAYSIGCWPAAFDLETETSIAEHLMRNPGGGTVAFVGNSRYGWGSPGNPAYGYSERFMQAFYRGLFGGGPRNAGSALAATKAEFVPLSRQENVYRWHQYELNLLGDPEMPVWTDQPRTLGVSHADSVVAGSTSFDVLVWTSLGPVAGALVCLDGGGDVYERAETGSDGSASLPLSATTPDSIRVTVTAGNCRPYEAGVKVNMTGAYVRAASVTTNDSTGGNGDGLPGPGETVELLVSLRNFGTEQATGVSATVATDDPFVQVAADYVPFGDIAGGVEVAQSTPFTLFIDPACANGHVARLDLTVSEGGARTTWTGAIALTIAAPVLRVASHSIDDSGGGDGDGILEPGESVRVMLEVFNAGLAAAMSPEAVLGTSDAHVVVTNGQATMPDVAAGGGERCVFTLQVAAGAPVPHFPEMVLATTTLDGAVASDTFRMTVGSVGVSYDFESGPEGWAHAGQNDTWTLTGNRAHSGATSWYSGSAGAWEYGDDMDAGLYSPEFILGVDSELSFWCWYEFPTYHEDGFYVELLSAGTPVDTLDFIGSGGALDHLGSIGNDWLEYRYPIGRPAGETLQVRFRFRSDDVDVAEGVYVDDVSITVGAMPDDTGVDIVDGTVESPIALHQNRPNPFSPSTTIGFTMTAEGPVRLTVYNIQGRLIRTLVDEYRTPGEHGVTWDGTDDLGADVAAGVYMYRLSYGEHEDTRKMILVR
ncbi:MAG: C25 family cysteine peptidase [Candidatus Eisenbacteria bacterium]